MAMKTKICSTCGVEFPKTERYFFKKTIKEINARGEIVIYNSFRSECKTCHSKKGNIRRIKKRVKEMGCNFDQYREYWKKQYSKTRTKHPEIQHLPESIKRNLYILIKSEGYKFTTLEQYKKDGKIRVSKSRRKYDYGDVDFVPQQEKNRCGIKNLTDGYIAATLQSKVGGLPKEIIETKRNILKLKRALNMTNAKVK